MEWAVASFSSFRGEYLHGSLVISIVGSTYCLFKNRYLKWTFSVEMKNTAEKRKMYCCKALCHEMFGNCLSGHDVSH